MKVQWILEAQELVAVSQPLSSQQVLSRKEQKLPLEPSLANYMDSGSPCPSNWVLMWRGAGEAAPERRPIQAEKQHHTKPQEGRQAS